ncbi:TPA: polysaccharide deacetylase family protein [Elizabethkingia anophelis]|nr:polysaccharide deacetylase family protein [Elizabethkingia anophelis]
MQIFQTNSPTRWKRFKWASRILVFILILSGIILFIAFRKAFVPNIPNLNTSGKISQDVLLSKTTANESKSIRKYQGFREYIKKHQKKGLKVHNSKLKAASIDYGMAAPIRAAYYVAWDAQSYFSLRRSINKINMIIPEWFFVHPDGKLQLDIDKRGFNLIKASKVKVLPMLSNNYKGNFDPRGIHIILTDQKKQDQFIKDLLHYVKVNEFSGINIDLENLSEPTNEPLINFQKNLYNAFHREGLLVTQDVMPFNEDYNYDQLNRYNDYIFLMAYDEFSNDTKPGPVSSQKWIEAAVDQVAKNIPSEKIVLGLAGYGYDWKAGAKTATDVTYQEALSTARETNSKVVFDKNTYNLRYDYKDQQGILHHVEFTDAVTNFNTLRFAAEYGLGGTALWRLGSEDNRLWSFYKRDVSKKGMQDFDFNKLQHVASSSDVDYIGEGEILDVASRPDTGLIRPVVDKEHMLITDEQYVKLPSMFVVKKWGKPKDNEKVMVLTFDDGPDPEYTPKILDILSKYKVPATFFVLGIQAEQNIPLVKRIYREGHEIGNHTFTHPNMAEVSSQRSKMEMDATRLLIESITGHSTILFRAPFNADSEPETLQEIIPVADSRERNYLTVGESIDPEDWQAGEIKGFNADTIVNRVIRSQGNGNIILLHDAGGPREATIQALPRIIEYFQKKGYRFTTVANLLGMKKDQVMPPVPKTKGYYIFQITSAIAIGGYYLGYIFFAMFIVFMILGALRFIWLMVYSYRSYQKEKHQVKIALTEFPQVDIIVPAYNEEVNIVKSLKNLLKCDYPNFHIIFIDDGSKDETFSKAIEAFNGHADITLLSKVNGGKASALNYGIERSVADYVVCIDADTQLMPNAVRLMMENMYRNSDKKVGAVAGNVKVGNEINLLTQWQSTEYIGSQNFDRRAFEAFNAITVVPGAIGLFKKQAIEEVGGFSTDTLAEDCDLTIKILRKGYFVSNETEAIAYTEAPEKLKQFMKQRFRWTFGVLQTFWKNKDAFFNPKFKGLGMIALPDMLVFKYIIPFFSPLADLLMVIGLFTGSAEKIGLYYLLFLIIDALALGFALVMEKASFMKIIWLIPQRIIYRWLMLIVLFKSLRKALKGELQSWGVLKRTGNVKDITETV